MKSVLSPRELGAAIGVSESSLKRWADSGRLDVARTAGGHRRIQVHEAIRFVREQGFPLQQPSLLGLGELEDPAGERPPDDPATALHDALVAGEAERARAIALATYIDGMPLALIVDRLIAPAMRTLGHRWQHADDGIMIEHRATDICDQVLGRIRALSAARDDAPAAVGGAPEGDPYVLPSLMAASVLASEGWSETNLAAHTPAEVLAQAAAETGARLVWLALSTEQDRTGIHETVEALKRALVRRGIRPALVVGGPAVADGPPVSLDGVYHAHSMTELAAFAQGLRSRPTAQPDGD